MPDYSALFPGDKKPGLLLRKTLPGECCPMAADKVPLIPEERWDELGSQITLRPHVKQLLDQDGVGSCAGEGTGYGVLIARAVAGLPPVPLNPWSVYAYSSGGLDRGSSIDENLRVAMELGIAPMEFWPRSKGWRAKPTGRAAEEALKYRIAEFWDITTKAEFVSCLLRGMPVVWGSKGHAVCAVQYQAAGPLIINSWGEAWGDVGFGQWARWSQINWGYGAFAVRCTMAADA